MKKTLLPIFVACSLMLGCTANEKSNTDYEKECRTGNLESCDELAYRYEEGSNQLKKNSQKAFELYKLACDKNGETACYYLGHMYQHGNGIEQDYQKAMQFYIKACDSQNAPSCNNIGYLYEMGQGVKLDYSKAASYYKMACEMSDGIVEACHNLGYLYEEGLGVQQSYKHAEDYYQKGCKLVDDDGCYARIGH